MRRFSVLATIVMVVSVLSLLTREDNSDVTIRRMVCVAGGHRAVIRLQVGDMLEVRPFDYPVNPKYLQASLKIRFERDRCLEYIGQTSSTWQMDTAKPADKAEGRSGRTAFIRAVLEGKSLVVTNLIDKQGDSLVDPVSYEVEVIPR